MLISSIRGSLVKTSIHSHIFIYANGNDKPPTAIDLNKSLIENLLFNHSPAKVRYAVYICLNLMYILTFINVSYFQDVVLASISMRPIPFSQVLEKFSLSDIKYGMLYQ
ncbi:hypothetical protein EJD97_021104 [Solanum chilense]|uniref:Uncharacterized protein n=1 Tax=Solanum chilense TaxID=4083 RepID=A0A6N2C4K7_SOLCI|nr:hypothetical protein EJD97_021104 [Solanum chilense]